MKEKKIGIIAAVMVLILIVAFGLFISTSHSSGLSAKDSHQTTEAPLADASSVQETPHGDDREIVCWGDSLTAGDGASYAIIKREGEPDYDASYKGYPEILADMTGLITYNFGVSGATSKKIGILQGALDDEDEPLPISLTEGNLARIGEEHKGGIMILEIGSNGGWDNDYAELIAEYEAMINESESSDYLILGDTDDPGTSYGDLDQLPFGLASSTLTTTWEDALQMRFGDRFINMRQFLIHNGLSIAGLHETQADINRAERGCVSRQLRSDWTHLNSYGYYAKAYAVYERGKQLGYW